MHVTLPKNFLNGYPPAYVNSIDVILDPWNLQKNTFDENRIVIIKTLNGIPLSNEQRNAMITDESGKNCAIFCQCGQKSDRNCSSCESKHKKNCAICIKNKIKIDDQDIYRQVCSIEDISIVDGPYEIYPSATASNLLQATKADVKTVQAIQATCSEPYLSKSTELSKGQRSFIQLSIPMATAAARSVISTINQRLIEYKM